MNDQETVEDRSLRLVTERFPHAVGAMLGGSAAQGRATPTSDLDIAILLPDSDASRREVIRHDGRLAELFLHTVADIAEFFAWDRARRRGTVLFLYDEGLILTDPHGHVARTRERARAVIATGPPRSLRQNGNAVATSLPVTWTTLPTPRRPTGTNSFPWPTTPCARRHTWSPLTTVHGWGSANGFPADC